MRTVTAVPSAPQCTETEAEEGELSGEVIYRKIACTWVRTVCIYICRVRTLGERMLQLRRTRLVLAQPYNSRTVS